MAITPLTSPSAHGQAPAATTERMHFQKQTNEVRAAVLQSTAPSLSTIEQPLALLYRTANEKLNEVLAPELGENAIQTAMDSGMDFSPEATAERIVSLSTGFFEAFRQQHAGEDESEVLEQFMSTIQSGIEQGFEEAREILDGLQVLDGDIATNIDRTYELIQEGLQSFRDQFQA